MYTGLVTQEFPPTAALIPSYLLYLSLAGLFLISIDFGFYPEEKSIEDEVRERKAN